MPNIEQLSEKAAVVNGASAAEGTPPSRSKTTKRLTKKSRGEPASLSVRYFVGGDSESSTPHLVEERSSEVEATAEAFRKQVSLFVVQEFRIEVQTHKGAPLLRKVPVKDRSSP